MTLHAAVSGWLLGAPSGANRRLLALLAHAGPALATGERITVLHRPHFVPPPLARIEWQPIAIPAAPSWRRALAEQRLLPKHLRDLQATVYDHGFLPLPRVPVPACLVVHDVRGADGCSRWPRWLARAVLRRSCRRAAAVIVPSEWTAARVRNLAPGTVPIVVANAADPAPAIARAPSRPLPANGYLLHVGHLERRKNLAVVVDALALVPRAARPQLWLAGADAGELRPLLARAAVGVDVQALGTVDDGELAALYGSARAVVVPSLHEGFGLPALEALAHGRAVLVSAASALPEVVGAHGTVLPPHDARAWAAAIQAPQPVPDSAARARHLAAFSWPNAAATLLATWRRIAR